jgi:hypothetical protein
MSQDYNRIDLDAHSQLSEFTADGVVRPGDLLARNENGVKSAPVAGSGGLLFAMHDRFQGKTIADNYADQDQVMCFAPRQGSQVWAWLADEQNVVAGASLTNNGSGSLVAAAEGDVIVAFAEESLDLSAGGNTADARIVVRIA